ncbi:MAG: hypothetical protein GY719_15610 [bacterium]|nr:hypothetical protein [bacterium]
MTVDVNKLAAGLLIALLLRASAGNCQAGKADEHNGANSQILELMSALFTSRYTKDQKDVLWETRYSNTKLVVCGELRHIARDSIRVAFKERALTMVVVIALLAPPLDDEEFLRHKVGENYCIRGSLKDAPEYLQSSSWQAMLTPVGESDYNWTEPDRGGDDPKPGAGSALPPPDLVFKLEESSFHQ